MTTRTVTNQGQPWLHPSGQPQASAYIAFGLRNAEGEQQGIVTSTGATVIGDWIGAADAAGEFSADLHTTDDLGDAYYLITRITNTGREQWKATLPAGSGALLWSDLIAAAQAL